MSIEVQCRCGKRLKASAALAGRRGKCPRCGRVLQIPEAVEPPRPAAPPAPAAAAPGRSASSETAPSEGSLFASLFGRQQLLAEAQVVSDPQRCVQCGICSYNCPMGIDVRAHARRGLPIHDSHCLTCSQCVNRCPRSVLRFDAVPVFTST